MFILVQIFRLNKPYLLFLIVVLKSPCWFAQQWQQNLKIVEPIRSRGSAFGLFIEAQDDYAIFSANSVDIGGVKSAGKVYVAKNECGEWSLSQELTLSETEDYCGFGATIAMDGTTLAIRGCDPNTPRSSAVYIYKRGGDGLYVLTQKITKPEDITGDNFALSMAISGDFMVVGASYNSTDEQLSNELRNAGAAYIYVRDNSGVWSLVQKITASDRGARDNFGGSVDVYENTIIIGAEHQGSNRSGAAYVFEKNGDSNNWNEVAKLVAYDFRSLQDRFGGIVVIDGDIIAIAARRDDDYDNNLSGDGGGPLTNLGSVYIFKKDNFGKWVGHQKLRASDGDVNRFNFGDRLELSGDKIAVRGMEYEYDASGNPVASYGNVYMFRKENSGRWNEHQIVQQDLRYSGDSFGRGMALSGEHLFIGAYWHDYDLNEENFISDSGAVYLFNTFDINAVKKPELNLIEPLTACENAGEGLSTNFNMSSLKNQLLRNPEDYIFYYKTLAGNSVFTSLPELYANSVPFTEKLLVRVESKFNSNCYEEAEIVLNVLSVKAHAVSDQFSCVENNDGLIVFDTYGIEEDILQGQTNGYVQYYDENNSLLQNPLPNPLFVEKGTLKTITAKVEHVDSECYDEIDITFNTEDCLSESHEKQSEINVPKFFTPNDDGINDYWNIMSSTHHNYVVQIFDRYGKLLKSLKEEEAWDGNFKGRPMPTADYWYRIVLNQSWSQTGHFSLKR